MHWPLRVYTPQAVVDGVFERLGSNREKLLRAVAQAAKRPKAEITLQAEATLEGKVRLEVEIRDLTRTGTSSADVYAAIVADGVESDHEMIGDMPDDVMQVMSCAAYDSRFALIHCIEAACVNHPVCEEVPDQFCLELADGWDYVDDMSGKLLNSRMVEQEQCEDWQVMSEMNEWRAVDHEPDMTAIGARWA